jgi:hypothetical protein
MSRTTFRKSDIVRAAKSAKAVGMKIETIEVVTTADGRTTIRVLGQREGEDASKMSPENLKDLV